MMHLTSDELRTLHVVHQVEAEKGRPARFATPVNRKLARQIDELGLVESWDGDGLTLAVIREAGRDELRVRRLAR